MCRLSGLTADKIAHLKIGPTSLPANTALTILGHNTGIWGEGLKYLYI